MDKHYRVPSIAIRLGEKSPDQIQLFRTGSFYHPEYGKFEITSTLLQEMKKNFDSKVRGIDIAVDYKHESDDVAAGWIKELFLSQDQSELWATVSWTPKGSTVLSDKEFRYISPDFTFNYQDNESLTKYGAVLLGAGLTNRPVIKKMEPAVELQEQKQIDPKEGEKMDELKKQVEQLQAQLAEMKTKVKDAEEKSAKLEGEKKLAEKKSAFVKLMSEGKACAAQEESYLAGDMDKFVQLAQPLNLAPKGTSGVVTPTDSVVGDEVMTEDEKAILEKARAIKAAEVKLSLKDAMSRALKENPTLAQKIYGKKGE